jgi:hypothetical protein
MSDPEVIGYDEATMTTNATLFTSPRPQAGVAAFARRS